MSKTDALGYYKVLEVAPDADGSEIKRQYYAMAKFWHPDHNEDSRAIEMFKKVSLAYDTLKDTKSRLQYDYNMICFHLFMMKMNFRQSVH